MVLVHVVCLTVFDLILHPWWPFVNTYIGQYGPIWHIDSDEFHNVEPSDYVNNFTMSDCLPGCPMPGCVT